MTTRSYSLALEPVPISKYSRASVERGLTHHFGPEGWAPDGGAGYTINTRIGVVHLRTLREAAIAVVMMVEKEYLLAKRHNLPMTAVATPARWCDGCEADLDIEDHVPGCKMA